MKWDWNSLKVKITAVGLLLIIFSISLVGVYANITAQKAVLTEIDKYLLLMAEDQASTIDRFIAERIDNISSLAKDIRLSQSTVSPAEKQNILQTCKDSYGDSYLDLVLVDRDGNYVASAGDKLHANYGNTVWFQGAISNQDVYYEFIKNEDYGGYCIAIAQPVRDANGSIAGVLSGWISISVLNPDLNKIAADFEQKGMKSSYAFILDKNGVLAWHTKPDKIGVENIAQRSDQLGTEAKKMTIGQKAAAFYEYEGVKKRMGYAPMQGYGLYKGMGWSLAITIEQGALLQPIHQMTNNIILIMLLALVLAMIVFWIIISRNLRPLDVLANVIKRISQGDIPDSIPDEYGGEFKLIRENLNICIQAINALIEDADMLAQAAVEGKLNTRADINKHGGDFQKIVSGVNHTLDAFIEPLNESLLVLSKMAVNDLSTEMQGQYQGHFKELADAINLVRTRLLDILNIFTSISKGDVSALDHFRQLGQRSENDKLIPAVVAMMQAIQELVSETNTLTNAAAQGHLDIRGNTEKFQGGYKEIVEGINSTLKAVVVPVKEASDVLHEMAQGNLRISVSGNYLGDHAEMKNALNHTIQTLNAVLGEIHQASEQIALGAGQVSDSSQSLSQASTEQASSTEEINATMAQIAEQTKKNAMNANQANDLAEAAKSNAIQGDQEMQKMLAAMVEINEASTNISKIIKVIDEIAFQTNILALNAAVEAARAGQHGKGFAVVAEEVRNLAARSANAAKETTAMIEGSIHKVNLGTKIANETAGALNQIVTGITTVADLVGEIAHASNEQATAIAQANMGISQVSEVTQMNTATAQESAAASQQLASLADLLRERVNQFKLMEAGASMQNISEMSPDVIKMIENIVISKTAVQAEKDESKREDKSLRVKPAIHLNEGDFGKY